MGGEGEGVQGREEGGPGGSPPQPAGMKIKAAPWGGYYLWGGVSPLGGGGGGGQLLKGSGRATEAEGMAAEAGRRRARGAGDREATAQRRPQRPRHLSVMGGGPYPPPQAQAYPAPWREPGSPAHHLRPAPTARQKLPQQPFHPPVTAPAGTAWACRTTRTSQRTLTRPTSSTPESGAGLCLVMLVGG